MSKALHDKLRQQGAADFKAGKPIEAFYEVLLPRGKRHNELYRASYETGWGGAQNATRGRTSGVPYHGGSVNQT